MLNVIQTIKQVAEQLKGKTHLFGLGAQATEIPRLFQLTVGRIRQKVD